MSNQSIIEYTLEQLKKQGADKSSCSLSNSQKQELNIEHGEMSLFRTTYNSSLSIEAFVDGKKGSTSINKTDKDSINNAVHKAIQMIAMELQNINLHRNFPVDLKNLT